MYIVKDLLLINDIKFNDLSVITEWLESLKRKTVFGELSPNFGDPSIPAIYHQRISTIYESNIIVRFENGYINNNKLYVQISFIGPLAEQVYNLHNEDKICFKPRGLCFVRGEIERYHLITFDIYNKEEVDNNGIRELA